MNKSCSNIKVMLFEKHNIDWEDYATSEKRGTAVIKDETDKWIIDDNMPMLIGDNRAYLEDKIKFENNI